MKIDSFTIKSSGLKFGVICFWLSQPVRKGGNVNFSKIDFFSYSQSAYIEEHSKENQMKKSQHSTHLQLFKETANCAS